MIPLYEVNAHVGGLEVVPDTASDKVQADMVKRYPNLQYSKHDFAPLKTKDPFAGKGQLVRAQPGDLILWDSRTIHGGRLGAGYKSPDECPLGKGDFARLSFTICMTPKKLAPEKVLEQRRQAFEEGRGTSHWPHEFVNASDSSQVNLPEYKPVQMTQAIKDLIG